MDVSLESLDILDIALNLLDKGTAHDLELFFIVAWTVWWNRNQATHDDIGSPPIQTWEITNRICWTIQVPSQIPSHHSSHLSPLGKPPLMFQINVDEATSGDSRNSSIGVIIRDSHGSTLAAMSKLLPMPYSAEVTKALALQGVRLAIEMNLSQTIFESNALSLVQALNSRKARGELGYILQEIRNAKNSFNSCSFQHLKREGNHTRIG